MNEPDWRFGATRLIKMMVELHRRGHQQLRICPYEYPLAWRLFIAPRRFFSTRNGAYAPHSITDGVIYSSSQGLDYFEWTDAKNCDAEQLASLFMKRFPKICEEGFGPDWEYAGWLSQLSGHVSRTKQMPFVMAEYFEPPPEELTYLPMRGESGDERFPLPPAADEPNRDRQQEIDDLRNRLWALEAKIDAAKKALA